ncbi:MAG: hypothetical protein R2818_09595 [Flavobacteriales bacterium]
MVWWMRNRLDTDSDSDGTADCNDGCPNDPNKIALVLAVAAWPIRTATMTVLRIVSIAARTHRARSVRACDDGDINTTNDQLDANCNCVGSTVDCNDNDPCTSDSLTGYRASTLRFLTRIATAPVT